METWQGAQFHHDNPNGYCPVNGTGVACPVGLGVRGYLPIEPA